MSFAFAGAHRTGKSTTAKIVAQRLGLPYLDSNVTKEMLAAGFDQVGNLDLERRMECQEKRLELHMEKYAAAPRPCITDRSPLDIAAYTLAEFSMHSSVELGQRAAELANRCVNLTRIHYDTLIVPRPLPVYLIEDGKPPPNVGFQHHVQYLIEGMATSLSGEITTAILTVTSLEDRCDTVTDLIRDRLEDMAEWRKKAGAWIN